MEDVPYLEKQSVSSGGSQFSPPGICDNLGAFSTGVRVKQSLLCDCLFPATLSVPKQTPGHALCSIDT